MELLHLLEPGESFRRALADLGDALRRNPELSRAYNNRACVHMRLGQLEAAAGRDPGPEYALAEADGKAAAARHAPTALLNLGQLYEAWGRPEEAAVAYESAARTVPAAWRRARMRRYGS